MSQFPLCTYIHDDGHHCRSAAVRGQQFCLYHLRHRGRLMRMAQSRALNQRLQLFLPPPEDPAAIHSALTQVIEALAADMIEPSRARALISGLRLCLQSLKKKDSWHDSAYHSDQPVDYENFEADYGLPKDIDINRSPEEIFPPVPEARTDNRPLTTDNSLALGGRPLTTLFPNPTSPLKPNASLTSAAAFLPLAKTAFTSSLT